MYKYKHQLAYNVSVMKCDQTSLDMETVHILWAYFYPKASLLVREKNTSLPRSPILNFGPVRLAT